MVNRLDNKKIVIGKKQTLRAISRNEAEKVYLSKDADVHVTKPIEDACKSSNVEIIYFDSMKELGASCGINVNAAAAAVLK
ncbi:MAG: ribosomal L7Ae/L30e/S12e/Gadd45 family protein [Tissierellia bacterium]|nr:ribosomal L7Ae/L30e/S12e/Gadd45 family protein [Tissierellia bacterium]MDD4781416.1 ribosomal L7Ae/L30e/S12e/Gadd45 family protein [Tissierellia bacterium]